MNLLCSIEKDTAQDALEILEELSKEIEQFDNTSKEYYARVHKVENKLGKTVKTIER